MIDHFPSTSPTPSPKPPGTAPAGGRGADGPAGGRAPSPPLEHLLQEVLLLARVPGGHVLVAHVPQLAGRVGLHGLAPSALLTGAGEDAALLWVGGGDDGQLARARQHPRR